MGEATARQHGYTGLPLLTVEQPFDRLGSDRVRAIAAEIAPLVIRSLSTSASELQEEFTGRFAATDGTLVDACVVPHGR
jgi:hypothetical protein